MLSVLEMSVTGGILIAAVVIARALAGGRLPKRAFLALWAVALARLLLPFNIPSPTSVYTAVTPLDLAARRAGVVTAAATGTSAAQGGQALPVWPLVWAAGALGLALFFLISHLRGRRRWSASLPVTHPYVLAWMSAHPLRRPVRVRCSDQIDTPFTYGVFRAVILLPKAMDWGDETRLSFILAHECSHIRRWDALGKLVLAAALCLHWFNPLVWALYVLCSRDMELACDETVLHMHPGQSRADYALTLVGMEERRGGFLPLCSCFSKNAMEERITAIMKSKKTTIAGIAAALVLVVVLTAVFATSAPRGESPAAGTAVNPAYSAQNIGSVMVQDGAAFASTNGWDEEFALKVDAKTGHYYTQEQYNLIAAFRTEGYESMSIAEFNRTLHALYCGEDEKFAEAYEYLRMDLPDDDPLAPFVVNTIQASLTEYDSRLSEVYSGKRQDPDFAGHLSRTEHANVYGDDVQVGWSEGNYTFTYRILDQDNLTVGERDAFLQSILSGMQTFLDGMDADALSDQDAAAKAVSAELARLGKAATTGHIKYTGGELDYFESDAQYW